MAEVVLPDSNSYRFFKTVDQSLVYRISREFDILGQPDTEGTCDYPHPTNSYQRPTPQNPVHWLELSPRQYAVCLPHPLVSRRHAHEPRHQPPRASYSINQLP